MNSQIAPIATAPKPSAERRSGASTPSVPKRSAGRTTNQTRQQHSAVAERAQERADRLRLLGTGCRRRGRPDGEAERRGGDGAERPAGPGDRGDSAEHGPEQRAADREGERLPDQRAAAPGRRRRDEPRERAGPRERAREALAEASEVELPRGVRDPEEGGRERDDRQPDEHRRLDAEARGDDPARDRADERAEWVGGREQPGAGLAEPERCA